MKKIFIKYKKEKFHIKQFSWKYWVAVLTECIAIVLWTIGILEVQIYHKSNPATLLIHLGGVLFTTGSFIYAKCIKHY
jgi:hypothetical protein